jgi:hypothetical protein
VIKPGAVFNEIGAHEDMLPTLVAAAGDTKVKENLFELQIERVDLESTFESTVQKYFFEADQLKQFVEHINEATRDHI